MQHLVNADPRSLEKVFKYLDRSQTKLEDSNLDCLLGISDRQMEKRVDYHRLKQDFGTEQYIYEGTPYDFIRFFLHFVKPTAKDVVYDLGSGYGRIVFYGALTTPAFFKGIEIVPHRVKEATQIKKRFGINNAKFIQGNVLDQDYSDGNFFFLFNPFYPETLEIVGKQLSKIAKNKKITIATWGGPSNEYFSDQKWLVEQKMENQDSGIANRLKIFESRE